jgi:hypothetical protein
MAVVLPSSAITKKVCQEKFVTVIMGATTELECSLTALNLLLSQEILKADDWFGYLQPDLFRLQDGGF